LERDQARCEDRDDNGHGKFAEDAAEQTGKKNQRNENGGERKRHRQNRERDFAGAIVGGFQDRLPVFGSPDDVFQEDNGVVDQEPDRERQRHEGEIVDRETEREHDRERDQDRQWQSHYRD